MPAPRAHDHKEQGEQRSEHKVNHRRHPFSSHDIHRVPLGWWFGLERNFPYPYEQSKRGFITIFFRWDCSGLPGAFGR